MSSYAQLVEKHGDVVFPLSRIDELVESIGAIWERNQTVQWLAHPRSYIEKGISPVFAVAEVLKQLGLQVAIDELYIKATWFEHGYFSSLWTDFWKAFAPLVLEDVTWIMEADGEYWAECIKDKKFTCKHVEVKFSVID